MNDIHNSQYVGIVCAVIVLYFYLEKFQLLHRLINNGFFLAIEQFYVAKLFVGDAHNAYFSIRRQHILHTANMYICILRTRAMAEIDRELKHGKTILQQAFSEQSIVLSVFLGLRWEVEKN